MVRPIIGLFKELRSSRGQPGPMPVLRLSSQKSVGKESAVRKRPLGPQTLIALLSNSYPHGFRRYVANDHKPVNLRKSSHFFDSFRVIIIFGLDFVSTC